VKKIVIAASAFALIASGITVAPANAAAVSASRATVGAQCAVTGTIAKGKGDDGSDLVCRVATIGTAKGVRQWLYA
jgi:putative tricarboxylic transport membrane protein